MKIQKILLFSFICLLTSTQSAEADWDITSIAQIVRNGPSTPEDHLYDDLTYMDELGGDSLTSNGERMMFNLGKWTKQNYDHVFHFEEDPHPSVSMNTTNLHPHYFISKIFSSSSKKSMQSAQAYLLGLHEPGEGGKPTLTDDKFLNPPFEGIQYKYTNESSVPYSFAQMNIRGNIQEYTPFFEEQFKDACPNLFNLHSEGKSEFETKYPIIFKQLREDLNGAGLEPKGYMEHEGWSDFNLRKYFEAAESYKANTGNYMPGLTEELYNRLWVYYSYSTELNFFEEEMNYSVLWTSNIITEITKVFDGLIDRNPLGMQFWDLRGITMFSTNGKQLYSFMQKLGFASKDCLLGVRNKTRPFMSSADKVNQPDYCQLYPEFGSSLTFQFATKVGSTEPYLRLLYNNQPLQILCKNAADDYFCPYYMLKQYLFVSMIGFDHEAHCNKLDKGEHEIIQIEKLKKNSSDHYDLFWGAAITACALFCIYLCAYCKNNAKEEGMIDRNVMRMKEVMESERVMIYEKSSNNENIGSSGGQKIERNDSPKMPKAGDDLSFDDDDTEKDDKYDFDEI